MRDREDSMKWRRAIASFLLVVGIAVGLLLAGDIRTFMSGGRPLLTPVDMFCGIFLHPHRDRLILRSAVTNDCLSLSVSHKWRGLYQPRLLVTDLVEKPASPTDAIGIECSFLSRDGNVTYSYASPPSVYVSWEQCGEEMSYGSELSFRMYRVPQNVPLDEEMTMRVRFVGGFDKFLSAHPNAYFIIEKERDK